MLTLPERIMTSCLNGGFLSVVIAWHKAVFHKSELFHWQTMMLIAGLFWATAAGFTLWYKRSSILQKEVPVVPPWYFFLLSLPLCIYAFLMPWALLYCLGFIIRVPTS